MHTVTLQMTQNTTSRVENCRKTAKKKKKLNEQLKLQTDPTLPFQWLPSEVASANHLPHPAPVPLTHSLSSFTLTQTNFHVHFSRSLYFLWTISECRRFAIPLMSSFAKTQNKGVDKMKELYFQINQSTSIATAFLLTQQSRSAK